MGKLFMYVAMSLDGKIAKTDESVGWLDEIPNPDEEHYGYGDFIKEVKLLKKCPS